MKDTIAEYIWFVITMFGTLISLRIVTQVFFNKSSIVFSIIDLVLRGLM